MHCCVLTKWSHIISESDSIALKKAGWSVCSITCSVHRIKVIFATDISHGVLSVLIYTSLLKTFFSKPRTGANASTLACITPSCPVVIQGAESGASMQVATRYSSLISMHFADYWTNKPLPLETPGTLKWVSGPTFLGSGSTGPQKTVELIGMAYHPLSNTDRYVLFELCLMESS